MKVFFRKDKIRWYHVSDVLSAVFALRIFLINFISMSEKFGVDNSGPSLGENVVSVDFRRPKTEVKNEKVDFREFLNGQVSFLSGAIEAYSAQITTEETKAERVFIERQMALCKSEREQLLHFLSLYEYERESKEVYDLIAEVRMAGDERTREVTRTKCKNKLDLMRDFLLVLKNYKFEDEYQAEKELHDMLRDAL